MDNEVLRYGSTDVSNVDSDDKVATDFSDLLVIVSFFPINCDEVSRALS